jgi:hypothetical protein
MLELPNRHSPFAIKCAQFGLKQVFDVICINIVKCECGPEVYIVLDSEFDFDECDRYFAGIPKHVFVLDRQVASHVFAELCVHSFGREPYLPTYKRIATAVIEVRKAYVLHCFQ